MGKVLFYPVFTSIFTVAILSVKCGRVEIVVTMIFARVQILARVILARVKILGNGQNLCLYGSGQ